MDTIALAKKVAAKCKFQPGDIAAALSTGGEGPPGAGGAGSLMSTSEVFSTLRSKGTGK